VSACVALGATRFAVVDIEATGIYATAHDRIIEIAVVQLTPLLEIDDEWATLVNPHRDIGRTDIHGIQAGDVAEAPGFEEIIGDVAQRIGDAIVVGHHLRFDLGFLAAIVRRTVAAPTKTRARVAFTRAEVKFASA